MAAGGVRVSWKLQAYWPIHGFSFAIMWKSGAPWLPSMQNMDSSTAPNPSVTPIAGFICFCRILGYPNLHGSSSFSPSQLPLFSYLSG